MLETTEDKKRFLASSEMCYDPMYQASMDTTYHHWMSDKRKKHWLAWKEKMEKVKSD